MSQNVYVNLKSLKTSVSGGRQTAFDKLSTAFGKYSKTGNDNNQVDKSTKYASRMDMLRVAVQDYLDPTAGMTDAQRERFIKKIYAKIQSGKKLTQDELAYLRRYDPVTYMKVARIQAQREALEAQLKCCKSKEEAQELYTDAVSRIPEDDPARAELLAAYDDAYGECEFPYKSRVMGTSEPLKPLKAPYMARNPVKWGFFRLKGQEIPLKI